MVRLIRDTYKWKDLCSHPSLEVQNDQATEVNDSLTHRDESGLVPEGRLCVKDWVPPKCCHFFSTKTALVKQEKVTNLLIMLVQVGRVTQIYFIFFANSSRILVIWVCNCLSLLWSHFILFHSSKSTENGFPCTCTGTVKCWSVFAKSVLGQCFLQHTASFPRPQTALPMVVYRGWQPTAGFGAILWSIFCWPSREVCLEELWKSLRGALSKQTAL